MIIDDQGAGLLWPCRAFPLPHTPSPTGPPSPRRVSASPPGPKPGPPASRSSLSSPCPKSLAFDTPTRHRTPGEHPMPRPPGPDQRPPEPAPTATARATPPLTRWRRTRASPAQHRPRSAGHGRCSLTHLAPPALPSAPRHHNTPTASQRPPGRALATLAPPLPPLHRVHDTPVLTDKRSPRLTIPLHTSPLTCSAPTPELYSETLCNRSCFTIEGYWVYQS